MIVIFKLLTKNLIRNNYGNYCRPCLKCAAAESDSLCYIYGTQNSSCPLFAQWEKTKKAAYLTKLPAPLESVEHETEKLELQDFDFDSVLKKLNTHLKNKLKPTEWIVYENLYLKNKTPLFKRIFFVSTILTALFLASSVSISVIKSADEAATNYGILFNEKIEVWAEPNTRAEGLFILHEGTKVQLLDALQEWQKIRIANGSEGWIKDGSVRSLKGFK